MPPAMIMTCVSLKLCIILIFYKEHSEIKKQRILRYSLVVILYLKHNNLVCIHNPIDLQINAIHNYLRHL